MPSIAQRYGGRAIVESACDGLVAPGTLVAGSFVDLPGEASGERRQYRHSQVLALIETHPGAAAQGRRACRAGHLRAWPSGKESAAAAASMPCWGPLNSCYSDARQRRGVDDLARAGGITRLRCSMS